MKKLVICNPRHSSQLLDRAYKRRKILLSHPIVKTKGRAKDFKNSYPEILLEGWPKEIIGDIKI